MPLSLAFPSPRLGRGKAAEEDRRRRPSPSSTSTTQFAQRRGAEGMGDDLDVDAILSSFDPDVPPPNVGPERLVFFHTGDPSELGIELTHSPIDGRIRVTHVPSDDERSPGGASNSPGRYRGVVEGRLYAGDVIREAAGVNLRSPVSARMWELTQGLMRVAPKPIEVTVAEEVKDDIGRGQGGEVGGVLNVTEEGGEGREAETSYYQLDVGHMAPCASPGARSSASSNRSQLSSPSRSPGASPGAPIRTYFYDPDRFGTERTVVFHADSLGIKLHRSPSEGIVHILHVNPHEPFQPGQRNDDYQPPREGPDDGRLDPGDAIVEVGGVDLRGKVIGVAEWADMVHFVKHVGRPLEMVVAKDKLFTRERAGVAAVAEGHQRRTEEVQNDRSPEETEADEGAEHENRLEGVAPENVCLNAAADCFNLSADDICNLPCGGDSVDGTPLTGGKKDRPWLSNRNVSIGKRSPDARKHDWIKRISLETPSTDAEEDGKAGGGAAAAAAAAVPATPELAPTEEEEDGSMREGDDEQKGKADEEDRKEGRTGDWTRHQGEEHNVWYALPMTPVSPMEDEAGTTVAPGAAVAAPLPDDADDEEGGASDDGAPAAGAEAAFRDEVPATSPAAAPEAPAREEDGSRIESNDRRPATEASPGAEESLSATREDGSRTEAPKTEDCEERDRSAGAEPPSATMEDGSWIKSWGDGPRAAEAPREGAEERPPDAAKEDDAWIKARDESVDEGTGPTTAGHAEDAEGAEPSTPAAAKEAREEESWIQCWDPLGSTPPCGATDANDARKSSPAAAKKDDAAWIKPIDKSIDEGPAPTPAGCAEDEDDSETSSPAAAKKDDAWIKARDESVDEEGPTVAAEEDDGPSSDPVEAAPSPAAADEDARANAVATADRRPKDATKKTPAASFGVPAAAKHDDAWIKKRDARSKAKAPDEDAKSSISTGSTKSDNSWIKKFASSPAKERRKPTAPLDGVAGAVAAGTTAKGASGEGSNCGDEEEPTSKNRKATSEAPPSEEDDGPSTEAPPPPPFSRTRPPLPAAGAPAPAAKDTAAPWVASAATSATAFPISPKSPSEASGHGSASSVASAGSSASTPGSGRPPLAPGTPKVSSPPAPTIGQLRDAFEGAPPRPHGEERRSFERLKRAFEGGDSPGASVAAPEKEEEEEKEKGSFAQLRGVFSPVKAPGPPAASAPEPAERPKQQQRPSSPEVAPPSPAPLGSPIWRQGGNSLEIPSPTEGVNEEDEYEKEDEDEEDDAAKEEQNCVGEGEDEAEEEDAMKVEQQMDDDSADEPAEQDEAVKLDIVTEPKPEVAMLRTSDSVAQEGGGASVAPAPQPLQSPPQTPNADAKKSDAAPAASLFSPIVVEPQAEKLAPEAKHGNREGGQALAPARVVTGDTASPPRSPPAPPPHTRPSPHQEVRKHLSDAASLPPQPDPTPSKSSPRLEPTPSRETPKLDPSPMGPAYSREEMGQKALFCSEEEEDDEESEEEEEDDDEEEESEPDMEDYEDGGAEEEEKEDGTNEGMPDKTPESSSHSHNAFLRNLRAEFDSDRTLTLSESRDDAERGRPEEEEGPEADEEDDEPVPPPMTPSRADKARTEEDVGGAPAPFSSPDATVSPKPQRRNHLLSAAPSGWTPQGAPPPMPPRGSVDAAAKTAKKSNAAADVFGERSFLEQSFGDVDTRDPESPFFAGYEEYEIPKQRATTERVPQSLLFERAFVVQCQGTDEGGEVPADGDQNASNVSGGSASPFLQLVSPRLPVVSPIAVPSAEEVNNSSFDMTNLEDSTGGGQDNVAPGPDETIVYADSAEEGHLVVDCCGALCGDASMFEGLVGVGGGERAEGKARREKERANVRVPSPRRRKRGLLGRLVGNKKRDKMKKREKEEEYGTLTNEGRSGSSGEEVGGVRKAHVQLRRQNIRGRRTTAAANQFALLIDDEICV
ncbi:hypothetical protein ACHAWF_017039 [Thalassiosira exigua]